MYLETFQNEMINEYGLQYMKEHECNPFVAIAALKRDAYKLYSTMPQLNPTNDFVFKVINHGFKYVYNYDNSEVYRIVHMYPYSIVVSDSSGKQHTMNQKFMERCTPINKKEAQLLCSFIVMNKENKSINFIQRINMQDKLVIVWTKTYETMKSLKRKKTINHDVMHISDFSKYYECVVQEKYLQLFN